MDAKIHDKKTPVRNEDEKDQTSTAEEKSQSPKDFYERVTKREDVREILTRLAKM